MYLNFTFSKYCKSFIQPEMFKVGICDEISSPGMSYLNNVYSKIRFGVGNSLYTCLWEKYIKIIIILRDGKKNFDSCFGNFITLCAKNFIKL